MHCPPYHYTEVLYVAATVVAWLVISDHGRIYNSHRSDNHRISRTHNRFCSHVLLLCNEDKLALVALTNKNEKCCLVENWKRQSKSFSYGNKRHHSNNRQYSYIKIVIYQKDDTFNSKKCSIAAERKDEIGNG